MDYDKEIETLAQQMIDAFPFRGSVNIQSKVTAQGIVPFEINCRISGTNSIRSQFGFNDVAFTIEELLFHETLAKPTVKKGSAMRVMVDVVYPDMQLSDINNKNDQYYIYQ
jgi:carbamoyl-phosphate synthase large subunit